jgi:hypothetical protein
MQPPTGYGLEAKLGYDTILVENVDDVIAQERCTGSTEFCRRSVARSERVQREFCAVAQPLPIAQIVYPQSLFTGPA